MWQKEKWVPMNLTDVELIEAGEKEVYALAYPAKRGGLTIYRWTGYKWITLPGKGAKKIAVGENGRLFIVQNNGKIFMTGWEGERRKCEGERLMVSCEESEICKGKMEEKVREKLSEIEK